METRCFQGVYKPNTGEIWINVEMAERAASTNVLANLWNLSEICLNFIIRTPESHWRRSGIFTANFEQISHIVLVFPWLTLNK